MSFSPEGHSREATPLSSASSQGTDMDPTTSSTQSSGDSSSSQGTSLDAQKFRKRAELEQAMHTLQQRLKLASVKAEHGWTDMSINEIENKKLPPASPSQRGRKPNLAVGTPGRLTEASTIPYEPPSPSRPWQLIDVLWQPLPPPSRSQNGSQYPTSPTSPLKRSRMDDEDEQYHPYDYIHAPEARFSASRTDLGSGRRASGSNTLMSQTLHLQSPVGQVRSGDKRRSQSHSLHFRQPLTSPTTPQDVDAANALASMLGSGSNSAHAGPSSPRRHAKQRHGRTSSVGSAPLIPTKPHSSLPVPPAFQDNEPIPRPRSSSAIPRRRTPPNVNGDAKTASPRLASSPRITLKTGKSSTTEKKPHDEEDKNAAELMMFLAHSPSPLQKVEPASPLRSMGGAARVLFADGDIGMGIGSPMPPGMSKDASSSKVERHSNLVLAPPITAEFMDEGGHLAGEILADV